MPADPHGVLHSGPESSFVSENHHRHNKDLQSDAAELESEQPLLQPLVLVVWLRMKEEAIVATETWIGIDMRRQVASQLASKSRSMMTVIEM